MNLAEKAGLYGGLLGNLLTRAPGRLNRAAAYLDAWNAHDIGDIVARTGDGQYSDPLSDGPVTGDTLAAHAQMLLTAFPDLRFALGPVATSADGVTAHYTLHATHTGPLPGDIGFEQIDPTGERVALPGVIRISGPARAPQVDNLFDQVAFARQIGFQDFLVPQQMRDDTFGAFYRLHKGNTAAPQAIGTTWIYIDGDQDNDDRFQHVATITRKVLEHLSGQAGFITGMVGARRPDRQGQSYGFTLTAWESLDHLTNTIKPSAEHKEVVRAYMKDNVAFSTHSRVYSLVREQPVMVACTECGKQNNGHKKTPVCSACKAPLPAPPPYW